MWKINRANSGKKHLGSLVFGGKENVSGEIKLFLKVLYRAILDLRHPKEEVRVNAYKFLFDPDHKGFAYIAKLLSVDPDYMRNSIFERCKQMGLIGKQQKQSA